MGKIVTRGKHLRPFLLVMAGLIIALAVCSPAHAAATITVVNLDAAGEGFNDPGSPDLASSAGGNPGVTLGQQRLIAFQSAANIWGALLDSTVGIRVGANFDPLPCNAMGAVLGSAGPNNAARDFVGAPHPGTWYAMALANKFAGTDLDPGGDDIGATFSSSLGTTCSFPGAWYYGLDANPPSSHVDFVTVVLHELGHGLGFLTFVDLTTGAKPGGFNDAYMLNLKDRSTGKLYSIMSNTERVTASTDTGELRWIGAAVVAQSSALIAGRDSSGSVEMYAPNPQQPGSSVSHWSTTLSPDELMEPSYTGPTHNVGLTKAVFTDLGWLPSSTTTIGLNRPGTNTFYLRNSNSYGTPDIVIASFGAPGDLPVVGDWDGNGTTTIGFYRPSTNTFYLRNSNSYGAPDIVIASFGAPGDLPVVGDWSGN